MKAFDINEFMEEEKPLKTEETFEEKVQEEEEAETPELDVQKAVVEALAEEKVKIEHEIEELKNTLASKEQEVSRLREENENLKKEAGKKSKLLKEQKGRIEKLEKELFEKIDRELDMQERNPNSLALLDREVELPDRFPGETRDHVIEVLREARDAAERDGRIRRAQILESVLVANEPNGTLAKKRAELEKLFADNGNLVSGEVIRVLEEMGISHKNGEEYLMPSEIIKRTY